MTQFLETCIKCKDVFLRGIFPQKLCPQCEIKEDIIFWSEKKNDPKTTT